ncbi:MAG: SdrD B-like domain-containing protein [Saprospiraceae bacterium]
MRGNVTADTNNDNVGDTPMQGVTIQLKDAVTGAVVATTTTNASGNYEFLNVAL